MSWVYPEDLYQTVLEGMVEEDVYPRQKFARVRTVHDGVRVEVAVSLLHPAE